MDRALPDDPHQAGRRSVGFKEPLLKTTRPGQGFGSQVSAAHGTLHGCWPASRCPISGEKHARPASNGAWAVGIDSRARGVSGVDFLDDGGFHELRLACSRKEFTNLTEGEIDDLRPGF